jgi:hypothetical protein
MPLRPEDCKVVMVDAHSIASQVAIAVAFGLKANIGLERKSVTTVPVDRCACL